MNLMKFMLPKMFFSFADGAAAGGAAGGGAGAAEGSAGAQASGSGAQGQQQSGEGNKMVPLATLIEERHKAQELKNELEALKLANAGQQQMGPQTNFYGNPMQQGQQFQQMQHPQQMMPPMQMQPMSPMQDPRVQQLWEEDPQRAVDLMINSAVSNAISSYDRVNSAVEYNIRQAATKYKDFETYAPAIRQELLSVAPNQRANPQVIDAAYFMVRGRNLDQLIQQQQQQFQNNIQGGQDYGSFGGGGTGGGGQSGQGNSQLTNEELNVAAAMGLSAEDYAASKGR